MISPSIRFHRIIKKLDRYVTAEKANTSLENKFLMDSDELFLGIYKGNNSTQDLIFTNKSLIFTDSNLKVSQRVAYIEIEEVIFPIPSSSSTQLILRLFDSTSCEFTVAGIKDSYRDVFEVGRFLMRVLEDSVD